MVDIIGQAPGKWCKFHKVKRDHIKDFYHMEKEIEHLIQEVHLKKVSKETPQKGTVRPSLM